MTEQDGKSLDMVNENLAALKAIFSEAFTEEGVDFKGAKTVDFTVMGNMLVKNVKKKFNKSLGIDLAVS